MSTNLAERQDWLPDYLLDLRFLLHDPSGSGFNDMELASYINEARTHVCVDTGCLRKRLALTLPGGQESFRVGGVYALNETIPDPKGTPPYVLASGAGATARCNTQAVPLTVEIFDAGSYYQPPLVTFDAAEVPINIGASASAVLQGPPSAGAQGIDSVFVTWDSGEFNANGVTPAVVFSSVGQPARLSTDGTTLSLASPGAGQSVGVVVVDAAGTVTDPGVGATSILDACIASIDQMTCIWGSQRVPMRNYAYSDFNIQMRGIVGFQSVPVAFCMYASTLRIGPVPNQAYQYELDCVMYPRPLLDYINMGEIMDRSAIMAVKYYAAYRARISQDEEQQAQAFLQLYQREIEWGENRFTTRLSQLYPYNENLD